jgi:hypothetical protein
VPSLSFVTWTAEPRLAVQWHPEERAGRLDANSFDAFRGAKELSNENDDTGESRDLSGDPNVTPRV